MGLFDRQEELTEMVIDSLAQYAGKWLTIRLVDDIITDNYRGQLPLDKNRVCRIMQNMSIRGLVIYKREGGIGLWKLPNECGKHPSYVGASSNCTTCQVIERTRRINTGKQ